MEQLEYNYKNLSLSDIRYRGTSDRGYYMLAFADVPPVNIDRSIFENVLFKIFGPLFMKDMTYDKIKKMQWNVHISEGCYYKWDGDTNSYHKHDGIDGRWYISRIDKAGVLSELTYSTQYA
jgi:hypothetical protein